MSSGSNAYSICINLFSESILWTFICHSGGWSKSINSDSQIGKKWNFSRLLADIIKVRSIAIMLSCEKWVEITWLLNTVKGKRARGEASSHCWSVSLKGKRRGCARLAGVFYGLLFSGGERCRIRSVELTGTLRDLFNKGDEQLQARDWPFSPCNFYTPSEIWTSSPTVYAHWN